MASITQWHLLNLRTVYLRHGMDSSMSRLDTVVLQLLATSEAKASSISLATLATRTFDLLYMYIRVLQTLQITTNSVTLVIYYTLYVFHFLLLQGVVNLVYYFNS